MSEFKFACPVCGQHITADADASGKQVECPTCFQKIVVPQAPASADTKLILSASQVGKPRPASEPVPLSGARARTRSALPAVAGLAVVLCAAGAAGYVFRDKLFKPATPKRQAAATPTDPDSRPVPVSHPIPTNFHWRLDLSQAEFPESQAAGCIRGSGFMCERAWLKGGVLTLRQGAKGPPELAVAVRLFARHGEELSGKTVEITADRQPPIPDIVLQWRNDQQKTSTEKFSGGYALKLAFGLAVGGRIPGSIYVCLPDAEKSFVAGTFDAKIQAPSPPKPRPPKPPPAAPPKAPAQTGS